MKKTILCFVLVLGIIVSLLSCISMPMTRSLIIDENNPPDQNAVVLFKISQDNGWFTIKEWNGVNIKKDLYKDDYVKRSGNKLLLTFPSGNNTITFDVSLWVSSGIFVSLDNIDLQYYFEGVKKYQVKGRVKTEGLIKKSGEMFIGLYDITTEPVLLKEWKVGEFKDLNTL